MASWQHELVQLIMCNCLYLRKEDAIRTGPGRISSHCDVICTGASPGRISSHCVIICTGASTGRISSHCDIICTGPGHGDITRANKFTLRRYLHGAITRANNPQICTRYLTIPGRTGVRACLAWGSARADIVPGTAPVLIRREPTNAYTSDSMANDSRLQTDSVP